MMPVQKQTRAGHGTRLEALVAIGDDNGHVGLGVQCSKEAAPATGGAIALAKLSTVHTARLLQEQDQQASHCPMQGDRPLWLCAAVPHPCPQRRLHRLSPWAQEADDDCPSAGDCTPPRGTSAKATSMPSPRTAAIYLTCDLWKETNFPSLPIGNSQSRKDPRQTPAVATTQFCASKIK